MATIGKIKSKVSKREVIKTVLIVIAIVLVLVGSLCTYNHFHKQGKIIYFIGGM